MFQTNDKFIFFLIIIVGFQASPDASDMPSLALQAPKSGSKRKVALTVFSHGKKQPVAKVEVDPSLLATHQIEYKPKSFAVDQYKFCVQVPSLVPIQHDLEVPFVLARARSVWDDTAATKVERSKVQLEFASS